MGDHSMCVAFCLIRKMSHFAEVENGIVKRVIVAEQDFIDSGALGDPKNWVQTYKVKINNPKYYYAGIGYSYDKNVDAFIPPKPFESWTLNTETYVYEPPIEKPKDGKHYDWDEQTNNWKELI